MAALFLAWGLLVAAGLGGRYLVNSLFPSRFSPLESFCFGVSVGLWLLTLYLLVVGWAGAYNTAALAGGLALLALGAGWAMAKEHSFSPFNPKSWQVNQFSRLDRFLLLPAAMAYFLLLVITASAPDIYADTLNYHLAAPYKWFQERRISFDPSSDFLFTIPLPVNLLYAYGFWLKDDRFANFLQLGFVGLVSLHLFVAARRYGSGRLSLLAPLLVLGGAMSTLYGTIAYLEFAQAFASLGAVLAVLRWIEEHDRRILVLGIFLAFWSNTIKIAAVFLPAFYIFLAVYLLRRIHLWRSLYPIFVASLLSFLVVLFPWLLKSYLFTGSPIYPFLTSVSSASVPMRIQALWADYHHRLWSMSFWSDRFDWLEFLILPVRRFLEIGYISSTDGNLGLAVFVFLTLSAISKGQWTSRRLLVFFLIYYMIYIWQFIEGGTVRKFMPVYPILCLAAGLGAEAIWTKFSGRTLRGACIVILLLGFAVDGLAFKLDRFLEGLYFIRKGLTREEYIAYQYRSPNSYRTFIKEGLPDGARIFTFIHLPQYALGRPVEGDYYFRQIKYNFLDYSDWDDFLQALKKAKVTHVILPEMRIMSNLLLDVYESDVAESLGKQLRKAKEFIVYAERVDRIVEGLRANLPEVWSDGRISVHKLELTEEKGGKASRGLEK